MSLPLATNARKIVQLRANGYRPDEMIVISMVGKLQELNHTVFADSSQEYDWKWCAGLEICVMASSAVKWMETVKAIFAASPKYLCLWDVDRNEGAEFNRLPSARTIDKPVSQWQYDMVPLVWIPLQNKMFAGELCS